MSARFAVSFVQPFCTKLSETDWRLLRWRGLVFQL